jgi:uncharacterized protein (TIGR02246 family)
MPDSEIDDLHAAVRSFSDAWARGDWVAVERLMSATYTHTDFAGEFLDRQGWLDYVRSRSGQPTRIDFDELNARILGDTAIVTGINAIHWSGGEAAGIDQRIRFTQVWRKREGRWEREAFHASLLPDGA